MKFKSFWMIMYCWGNQQPTKEFADEEQMLIFLMNHPRINGHLCTINYISARSIAIAAKKYRQSAP